jgi:predicted dienelactone hydrolase
MSRLTDFVRRSISLLALGSTVAQAESAIVVPRGDGANTPMAVYEPATSSGCPPLAVLSHGVGGSEKDLVYLAQALSQDGWLAILMGHRESGRSYLMDHIMSKGLKAGALEATTQKPPYDARMLDIAAVLKWADARCHAPFKAMLGHSMGAATVMMEAGAHNKLDVAGLNRFDAYVALSPQGPGSIFTDDAWKEIRKPVLMMTGTEDSGTEGTWQWRTEAYKRMAPGCKWLGVIDGAGHLSFADVMFSSHTHDLVVKTSIAFLDNLRASPRCPLPQSQQGMTLESK